MPSILRIFLYQTDASLSVIGSTESYGTTVPILGSGPDLEHDRMSAVRQYDMVPMR